jgi:hypothetical protein
MNKCDWTQKDDTKYTNNEGKTTVANIIHSNYG